MAPSNSAGNTVRIRYVDRNGEAHDVCATVGDSLMVTATNQQIKGIGGDCGGNCACGTCRIRIDSRVQRAVPPPEQSELELLEFLGSTDADLRLGCQLTVTQAFDGVTIKVDEAD